jgi:hypothetical protein
MSDITNVKLGICSVTFDDTDLGHTKGGVTVTYEPTYHDVTVDAYGETVVDKKLLGERLVARVPLAESTLANLQVAIPEGTTSGSKLTIGSSVGDALSDEAAELVLHPSANASDNLDDDVVFHTAVVASTIELPYVNDGERIIEVEFVALLDESKSDGNYLGFIGDSTS